VVIVSVFVDRDRIRERLTRAGVMLAPAGQGPEIRSRLVLENLGEYWAYAEIRRVLLDELKVQAAVPREFSPGLAVLEVTAAQPPRELLDSLQRSVSDRMDLIPVRVDPDEIRLRVEVRPGAAANAEAEAGASFDTRGPNRY